MNADQQPICDHTHESGRSPDLRCRRDILQALSADLFGEEPAVAGKPARSVRLPWPDDPNVRRALEARMAEA